MPLQVLLCDDAVMYATMLSVWFDDDPDIAVVGIASSAHEGMEKARELQPDVIVLDHLLPDGSSAQVIPQLRASAPRASFVLISGLIGEMLQRAAQDAGAEGWVSKASNQDAVRTEILRVSAANPGPGSVA